MQRSCSAGLRITTPEQKPERPSRRQHRPERTGQTRCGKAVTGSVAWMLMTTTVLACDHPFTANPVAHRPSRDIVSGPVSDRTMGSLSALARRVSIAMQDPTVRGAVLRAMKDTSARGAGLDLTRCQAGSIVHELLIAAEKRGERPASAECAELEQHDGLLLYMAPDRLAAWDSTSVPIVTAVADLQARVPPSFRGYRSPNLMIDIPSDGSLRGPILVVAPVLHPERNRQRTPRLLPTAALLVHADPFDTTRVPMPNIPIPGEADPN